MILRKSMIFLRFENKFNSKFCHLAIIAKELTEADRSPY